MQTYLLAGLFLFPILWKAIEYRISKQEFKGFWKHIVSKFGFSSFKVDVVWKALLLCGALLIGNFIITFIFSFSPANDLDLVSSFVLGSLSKSFLIYSLLLVLTVFVEEFFFRAFLVDVVGWFFSTLLFAGFHIGYGSVFEVIGAFLLGLILVYTWKKTRNIYVLFFGHLLYNAVGIGLLFIAGLG